MIISHSRKFIFIKASKVAGTSVQKALAKICDGHDIVVDDVDVKLKLYQHETPISVKRFVGEDVWRSYRKIVIIRNPWDALVSHYFFAHASQKIQCPAYFERFVWWNISGAVPLNKNHWLIQGGKWADVYIRFEHLESDCVDLFRDIGVDFTGLTREVSGFRPSIHYSIMYNQVSMEMVEKTYMEEIKQFGYAFEHIYQSAGNGKSNYAWNTSIQV